MIYVILYLVAIVLANLSVAQFGPGVVIVNAFLFIGLDLTVRDRLHDAWPEYRVLAEVEGGIWMQTSTGRGKGHASPQRFIDDCEKYNEAALLGWTVIRASSNQVESGAAVAWLERALTS